LVTPPIMPETSRRTAELGTENAFVVLAEVNELARQGKNIISFCIGQPDFHTPVNIQDAAVKAIREGRHGYTPSAGIAELRAAAAQDLGRLRGLAIDPEHVVIGAGAKPFIAYTILCTTDYGIGDEVIYPNPGFPIYESQILAHGAVPVPLYLGQFASIASLPGMYERAIISDGASKTWAMTGWRIGYASNPILAPQFVRWVTNTDSCASHISQWAALEALSGPQEEPRKMRESFLARRDLIVGLLNRVPGVSCKLPGEGQHIRFSYAASNRAIEEGVARMADFIRTNSR